jgi:hypothetical protein
MSNRPVQPVSDDQLKRNAPLWKRILRPSMPEWTPAKIAATVLGAIFLTFVVISVIPSERIHNFSAESITAQSLLFDQVTLVAYDGMGTEFQSVGEKNRSRSYSRVGGIVIEGTLTNNTANEIFVTDVRFLPQPIDFEGTEFSGGTWSWPEPDYELIGAAYAKNWNQLNGYVIPKGETAKFNIAEVHVNIDSNEPVKMATSWIYIDTTTLELKTATPVFTFASTGSSRIRAEPEIRITRPIPEYRPDLGAP